MRSLANTFKALSDETRLLCLTLLLSETELCVCDLEHALAASQSKTSRHLRYLLHAGLVSDRREGTWIYYRIAETLSPEQRCILDTIANQKKLEPTKSALKRLAAFRKSGNCGA